MLQFCYFIVDEDGLESNTAVETIPIRGSNDPPDAEDDSNAVGENGSVSSNVITPNDSDPEMDELTVIEAGRRGLRSTLTAWRER